MALPHAKWNTKQAITSLQQLNARGNAAALAELPPTASAAEQQAVMNASNQRHMRRYKAVRRQMVSLPPGSGSRARAMVKTKAKAKTSPPKKNFSDLDPGSAHFESVLNQFSDHLRSKRRNNTWAIRQKPALLGPGGRDIESALPGGRKHQGRRRRGAPPGGTQRGLTASW